MGAAAGGSISSLLRLLGRAYPTPLALVLVVMVVLTGCGDDGETVGETDRPEEPESVTFALSFLPEGWSSIFYTSLDFGWFEDEGLDLEITRGFGSGDTISRVATGDVDIGMADIAALVPLRLNEDIPVVAVAAVFAEPFHAVYFRVGDGIEEPADLEGRSIACSHGNANMMMFPAFAQATGIDGDAVEWKLGEPPTIVPAFTSGQADAACYVAGEKAYVQAQSDEEIERFAYAEHGVTGYSQMIIASERTLEERPELVAGFVRALQRGMEFAVENPQEAVEVLASHEPELDPDLARATWEETIRLGLMDNEDTDRHGYGYISPERMETTFQTLIEASDVEPGDYTAEDLYTTEFLP
jgi:NitT/TauT family transport system substrate-binding protein